jgi:hypothetical protein
MKNLFQTSYEERQRISKLHEHSVRKTFSLILEQTQEELKKYFEDVAKKYRNFPKGDITPLNNSQYEVGYKVTTADGVTYILIPDGTAVVMNDNGQYERAYSDDKGSPYIWTKYPYGTNLNLSSGQSTNQPSGQSTNQPSGQSNLDKTKVKEKIEPLKAEAIKYITEIEGFWMLTKEDKDMLAKAKQDITSIDAGNACEPENIQKISDGLNLIKQKIEKKGTQMKIAGLLDDFEGLRDTLQKVLDTCQEMTNETNIQKVDTDIKNLKSLEQIDQEIADKDVKVQEEKTKHKEECIKYYKSYQTASKKNKDGRYDTNIEAYKAFFDRPKKLSNGTTISCKDFKRISTFERFKWDNI